MVNILFELFTISLLFFVPTSDLIARRRLTYCVWENHRSPEWLSLNSTVITIAVSEGCLFARKFKPDLVPLSTFLRLVYSTAEPAHTVTADATARLLVFSRPFEDPMFPYRVHVAVSATVSPELLYEPLAAELSKLRNGSYHIRHPDPLLHSATTCPGPQQGFRIDVQTKATAEALCDGFTGLKVAVEGVEHPVYVAARVSMDEIGLKDPVPLPREVMLAKAKAYGFDVTAKAFDPPLRSLGSQSRFLVVVCAGDGWLDLCGREWLSKGM